MLKIKEANFDDVEQEYAYMTAQPAEENGFINSASGCDFETYRNTILPRVINWSKGIDLPEGYVPCTDYFLWDDDTIVGLFHFRHHLNDFLANGAGHIGYIIAKEYRNKGYAKKGLALVVEIAKKRIPEDEIYMSCNQDNLASFKVQLANGAYLHHQDETKNYTRIPIKNR